jgi:hypothetical protein
MITKFTNNKFKIFDNIMLREDIPDYPWKKGTIGAIVLFPLRASTATFVLNSGVCRFRCIGGTILRIIA